MWDKVKGFFGWIVAGIIGFVGILLYLLKRKDEQLDAEKAKNALSNIDKKSAILDNDIKHLEKTIKDNQNNIDNDNKKLDTIKEEKENALDKERERQLENIEDYWNKEK